MNKTILVLAKFDSFARVAKRVADGFAAAGFQVDYRLIAPDRREALSSRMHREIGLAKETPVTTPDTLFRSGELAGLSAVYLGGTGAFVRNFIRRMREEFAGRQRPLTLTGYPGVILREKLFGFANRCGCDFVLLNASADLDDYRAFCRNYGLDAGGAQLFGYVFPPFHKENTAAIRRVLFAEQAAIPATRKERLYLIHRLIRYAARHQDREVVIKPRLVPGETSIFTTKHHLEYLLRSFPELPANLRLEYGDIQGLLEQTDLCLTVSSTVALQAMWYGVPTGIIRDFGIRDEYGTDFFRESGCLVTFDDLERDALPSVCPAWFSRNFAACDAALPEIAEAVAREYARREQCGDWSMNGNPDAVFCEAFLGFRPERFAKKHRIAAVLNAMFRRAARIAGKEITR